MGGTAPGDDDRHDPSVAALDATPDHAALVAPPPGHTVRRPDPEDLAAVAALYAHVAVTSDRGTTGRGALRDEADLHATWEDRRGDAVLVERDGRLVGYADFREVLDPWTPALDLHAEGRVDPAARDAGVGTFLLARALARARRAADRSPDLPTALRTTLVDPHDGAVAFFEQRGFEAVRHLLQLRLDLDGDLPPADWPADARPVPWQKVTPRAIHRALRVAFADHHLGVTEHYDTWRLVALAGRRVQEDASVVAVDERGAIVGLALGRVEGVAEPGLGVVGDLGVVPAWRGRGLATALLRASFAGMRELGARRVGLEVDDVTLDGALRLYERAGMEVVHHTVVLERPLSD